MATVILYISLVLLFVSHTWGVDFSPNVTVRSCDSRTVTVDLENAADGGIVYIQGRSEECRRTTASQKTTHQFDFDTCSIDYDSKFRLIIQRNPRYQTGTDKVIPVMCLVDTRDIYVSSVIFPEEILDAGSVNKTIRPIINMALLSENESNVIKEVTLDDRVKLNLQLDSQYTGVFDIKATNCSAALIPILENECSIDDDLFPNFIKMSQGKIVSTFNAFQPTNLPGDTEIEVGFTCTVSVCKGACDQTICGEIFGWGRRKRDSVSTEKIIEDVILTTKLKVKPKVNTKTGAIASDRPEYCAEKAVVTTVTGLVILVLIFSWLICGCALCKLRRVGKKSSRGPRMPSAIRRISEINTNFAKSVGRRLSTIFMPTGYDVRDPRVVDGLPVYHTPPSKRRESVTVRTDDLNNLRKRCVSSATQTTDCYYDDTKRSDYNDMGSISSFEDAHLRNMPNPITSISISSAATKNNRSSIKQKPPIPRQNSEYTSTANMAITTPIKLESAATVGSLTTAYSMEDSMSDSIEPIVQYDVDEIPKARKPYVGVIQVRNAKDFPIKQTSEVDKKLVLDTTNVSGAPKRETLRDDGKHDSFHDENNLKTTNETKIIKDGKTNQNDISPDIYSSFGEVGHSDHTISYDTIIDRVGVQEAVLCTDKGLDAVEDVDADVRQTDVDDVYEVIEIGAQIKRERKYSTHV